jgi:hypothetical protein
VPVAVAVAVIGLVRVVGVVEAVGAVEAQGGGRGSKGAVVKRCGGKSMAARRGCSRCPLINHFRRWPQPKPEGQLMRRRIQLPLSAAPPPSRRPARALPCFFCGK